jgi:hypothetical protein
MQKSSLDTSTKSHEFPAHRKMGLPLFVGSCLMALLTACGAGTTVEENTPEEAPLAETKSELSGTCGGSYANTSTCSIECQPYGGTDRFCYVGQPWQCRTATYDVWYVSPWDYRFSLASISQAMHVVCATGEPTCPTFCNL